MLEMPKKSSRFFNCLSIIYQFSQGCVFDVFCKLHIAIKEIMSTIKQAAQGKMCAPIRPLKP